MGSRLPPPFPVECRRAHCTAAPTLWGGRSKLTHGVSPGIPGKDDLAEIPVRLHMAVCVGRLRDRKGAVDHGVQGAVAESGQHRAPPPRSRPGSPPDRAPPRDRESRRPLGHRCPASRPPPTPLHPAGPARAPSPRLDPAWTRCATCRSCVPPRGGPAAVPRFRPPPPAVRRSPRPRRSPSRGRRDSTRSPHRLPPRPPPRTPAPAPRTPRRRRIEPPALKEIGPVDARRMHPHHQVTGAGPGCRHGIEPEDAGLAEFRYDDGSHRSNMVRRAPCSPAAEPGCRDAGLIPA